MTRKQRRATDSEFLDQEHDIDNLRERLGEAFAELQMVREEAARYYAHAHELQRRLSRIDPDYSGQGS
ncbi:MAG: hypothetical protein WEB00_09325 [Dehalococcoidia bacterium]